MKKISAVMAALAAAAIFTACGNSGNTEAESVSEITSVQETEEATSAQEQETAQPAETVSISAEEKAEIQALLTEAGKFSYGYLECKEIKNHINEYKYITTTGTNVLGEEYETKWYLIDSGDITTKQQLTDKMYSLFTENGCSDYDYIWESVYKDEGGSLYLTQDAGSNGSLLGTDYAYIVSAEEPDDETIVLNMTAFGAGKNWDLDHDLTDDFSIRLKRTDDGLRVDTFDPHVEPYITWAYTPERDLI